MTREELHRRCEEHKAEERRRRNENLAKRRNKISDEDWQDLEWMAARLRQIMDENPQTSHALYHAWHEVHCFTNIA